MREPEPEPESDDTRYRAGSVSRLAAREKGFARCSRLADRTGCGIGRDRIVLPLA